MDNNYEKGWYLAIVFYKEKELSPDLFPNFARMFLSLPMVKQFKGNRNFRN